MRTRVTAIQMGRLRSAADAAAGKKDKARLDRLADAEITPAQADAVRRAFPGCRVYTEGYHSGSASRYMFEMGFGVRDVNWRDPLDSRNDVLLMSAEGYVDKRISDIVAMMRLMGVQFVGAHVDECRQLCGDLRPLGWKERRAHD